MLEQALAEMTNVERLAGIVGSKKQLALIMGVHPSQLHRLIRYGGTVPPLYNNRIREALAGMGLSRTVHDVALAQLEPDRCPTCGAVVETGMVL